MTLDRKTLQACKDAADRLMAWPAWDEWVDEQIALATPAAPPRVETESRFNVYCGNYFPREVDSTRPTREQAEARVDELDGDWRIEEVVSFRHNCHLSHAPSPEPAQDGARTPGVATDSATQPLEAAGGEAGQGGRPRPDPASPHVADLRLIDACLAESTRLQSALAQAEQEREKYRIAAGVLCGAHIGIPQSRCPVCERDEARREAAALLARISGAL